MDRMPSPPASHTPAAAPAAGNPIDRQVRAFNPFPGAVTRMRDAEIKIWQAVAVEGAGEPGAVIESDAAGIVVAGGTGALRLEVMQRAGGKRLPAREFQRGFALAVGERFE